MKTTENNNISAGINNSEDYPLYFVIVSIFSVNDSNEKANKKLDVKKKKKNSELKLYKKRNLIKECKIK